MDKNKKYSIAKDAFSALLVDSIFSYWYGTPWDFNGHTTTPRKGEIACGYFVTTTMRDIGIPINRIKMAQKASAAIIEGFCDKNSIRKYRTMDALLTYLKDIKDGEILILGLEFHVGYVIKIDGQSYFIHSNYLSEDGVMKELLHSSANANQSNFFMIGNLSKNKKLILNWAS